MFFLDTSALIKRYVIETGSSWVNGLLRNGFIVSTITYAEVASALARRVKGGTVSTSDQAQFLKMFDFDMEHRFWLIEVDKRLCQNAGLLAAKHTLRGYDSVQLACALKANNLLLQAGGNGLTFLTADKALLAAATAENLATDNPENY